MMKGILLAVFLLGASYHPAMAATNFMSDVVVLDKAAIVKLTDEQLIENYMNVIVDLEASKSFHQTNGFSAKDYKEFKDLIRFRLLLLTELHSRNVEIPQFDRSL